MEVSTEIRRTDLVRFNLFMLPRARSNLVFLIVLGTSIFVWLLAQRQPVSVSAVAISAIAAALGAVGGLLAGFVISTLFIICTSSLKSGVLGPHTYRLSSDGLHEFTPVNESLQKWSGVHDVGKSRAFVYVRINGYLFHLIPRRSFPSDQSFDAFCAEAQNLWKRARAV